MCAKVKQGSPSMGYSLLHQCCTVPVVILNYKIIYMSNTKLLLVRSHTLDLHTTFFRFYMSKSTEPGSISLWYLGHSLNVHWLNVMSSKLSLLSITSPPFLLQISNHCRGWHQETCQLSIIITEQPQDRSCRLNYMCNNMNAKRPHNSP